MKPMRRKYNKLKNPAPETEALSGLKSVKIPPPARERMLEAVYEQADLMLQDEEERKMHPFYSLFAGKRFSTRLAAGVAIALVMIACLTVTLVPRPQGGGFSLEPAQPALASQPGYLLAAFTSAEDEAAAKAEAQQLQKLAQELIALKQGEFERFQQMITELQAELAAKQELIAQELEGKELQAADQAKLAELETKLAEKAAQLEEKSDRLLELAGLLSAKEQFVRQQADMVKLNLEGLELPDGVEIKTSVEQIEDGKYQIYLTLPNVPAGVAEELKIQLDGMPGLDQVEVDGVSFVTGVDEADAPKVLRELKLDKPGKVISKKIMVMPDCPDGVSCEGKFDVKDVDGQIVVLVEGVEGDRIVVQDGDAQIQGSKILLHTSPDRKSAGELKIEEIDQLYQVIVTGDEAEKTFTIKMQGDGAADVYKQVECKIDELGNIITTVDDLLNLPGAKLFKGELGNGDHREIELEGIVNIEDSPDKLKKLQELGYIKIESDSPERMQELLEQGLVSQHEMQVLTEELVDGQLKLKVITEGDIPEGEALKLEQMIEMDPELKEKMAQIKVMGDSMAWTVPGENTLSITLDEDEGGKEPHTFGWVNDDELGHFVLIGENGDELRAVEVGDAKVYIGNQEAFQPELKEVRAYLKKHYAGTGAGFKATGKDGKLTVKVLLEGQVAEVLTAERTADGKVVITNQG